MVFRLALYPVALLFVGSLVGCVSDEAIETGLPDGWEADSVYWWHAGFDTTGVFRDLETLDAMNAAGAEVTYMASPDMARNRSTQQALFKRAVKRSLLPLYRNHPEVVDSLFERHVTPMLREANLSGNLEAEVERFKRKSYQFLHKNYFQAPQKKLQIGRDITVPYPEALRKRQVGGEVFTQIYVNEEGEPLAIELLESVDPTLDAIALRAMTEMRWRPAYLMRRGRWVPIPAWTRFSIRFGMPG